MKNFAISEGWGRTRFNIAVPASIFEATPPALMSLRSSFSSAAASTRRFASQSAAAGVGNAAARPAVQLRGGPVVDGAVYEISSWSS